MPFDPSRTHYLKKEKRYRARIMLPAEMLLYAWLLVIAIAGGLGEGTLRLALQVNGDVVAWMWTAVPLAAFGLAVACIEWRAGEAWGNARVVAFAVMRICGSLLAIAVWIYLVGLLSQDRFRAGSIELLSIAPVVIVFHGWAALMAKRAYVILHEGYDTGKLEADLDRKRLVA